jgi:hypothetical protein
MTKKLIAIAALCVLAVQVGARAQDGAGFLTGSCAYPAGKPLPGSGAVLKVGAGQAYATIQNAVDAASEGDTVLVAPGTYHESVDVRVPGLRIRGTDRNSVILDGGATTSSNGFGNGISVYADRVVIENMTAHNYEQNGFFWTHLTGYRGSYLTAYNNGRYGVYAYDARCGELDHSFARGNADSGFYIGECFPCDAVITNIISDGNALGYSGTNAGGNLILRDSEWRNNGLGIVPNTLDSEKRPPQRGVIIKNNLVTDNNGIDTPGTGIAGAYWGGGIVIAGGQGNQVYGNLVTGHSMGGVVISPLPDANVWIPNGNTVWGNRISGKDASSYDIAQAAASGTNNCYADNVRPDGGDIVTAPAALQTVWSCSLTATPPGGDPRVELSLLEGQFPPQELGGPLNGRVHSAWQTWPVTAEETTQPNQPDDNGNASFDDDGAVNHWLADLGY